MKLTSVVSLGIASLGVLVHGQSTQNSTLNPLKDDFYQAPKDYKDKKPGEILKHREAPAKLKFKDYEKAYQLMYRTTDSLNNATYCVTTVIVPKKAQKDRFISYQFAEDSSWAPCAPSFSMTKTEEPPVELALKQGITVVAADYEGPNSAFTAGRLAGHAVLDSIRAVLKFKDSGLDKQPKIALWGYSGGSLASGWAAQLQHAYAPELDKSIVGTAVGGFVTNISAVALANSDQMSAGFIPAGIVGLGTEYPAIGKLLKDGMFPSNSSEFMKAKNQCMLQDLLMFANQDIFTYFKKGENVLAQTDVSDVLKNVTMGGNAPKSPLFVYQGTKDEIVPVKAVDSTIDEYCDDGASVIYNKVPGKSHTEVEKAGRQQAFDWLKDRMDGKKADKGCKTTTTNMTASSTSSASKSGASGSAASATGSGSSSGSASSSSSLSEGAATSIQAAPVLLGIGLAAALLV